MAGVKVPRLRAIRESRPLSQEELAKKAGVSRLTIGKIEGGNPAFPSTIRRLAEALGVDAQQLMGTETTNESSRTDVWSAEPPPATPGEQGEEPRG